MNRAPPERSSRQRGAQHDRRRLAVSLAAALALHGGLLLWVAVGWKGAGERPPEPRRMAVELRERAAGATVAEPARTATAATTTTTTATTTTTTTTKKEPGAGAGAGAGKADPGTVREPAPALVELVDAFGVAPEAPAGLARGSTEWLAREGVQRAPGGVSIDLRDPAGSLGPSPGAAGGLGGEGVDPGGILVGEPSRAEKLAQEKAVVSRRVRSDIREFQAQERVSGVRDAYWQDVQGELARGFRPDWTVGEAGPTAPGPHRALRGAVEAYTKQAEAFGKTGTPFAGTDPSQGGRAPLNAELRQLPAEERGHRDGTLSGTPSAALALQFLSQAAFGEGTRWNRKLVVLVRVLQADDGSLLAAELVGSSGNHSYDRLVLQQARALGKARLLGAPPPQRRETLWAFETDFIQLPPFPIAGCALDANFVPGECYYPLKKMVRPRVKLLGIY